MPIIASKRTQVHPIFNDILNLPHPPCPRARTSAQKTSTSTDTASRNPHTTATTWKILPP